MQSFTEPSRLLGSYDASAQTEDLGGRVAAEHLFLFIICFLILFAVIFLFVLWSASERISRHDPGRCFSGHYYVKDWDYERHGKSTVRITVPPRMVYWCDEWEHPFPKD